MRLFSNDLIDKAIRSCDIWQEVDRGGDPVQELRQCGPNNFQILYRQRAHFHYAVLSKFIYSMEICTTCFCGDLTTATDK
jgi:hypothetical protein